MPNIQHLSGWTAVDEFIDQVVARLEETEMTISALAEETGISRQHIHRILTGKYNLSMAAAQTIAEALDLRIATIDAV